MRRRLVRILAFPIIALVFLIGWVLYCIGGKHDSLKKKAAKELAVAEKQAELVADEGIEMGLIEKETTKQNAD
jgi:hypothetical protein